MQILPDAREQASRMAVIQAVLPRLDVSPLLMVIALAAAAANRRQGPTP